MGTETKEERLSWIEKRISALEYENKAMGVNNINTSNSVVIKNNKDLKECCRNYKKYKDLVKENYFVNYYLYKTQEQIADLVCGELL